MVVSIIVLLVALLVPSLQSARRTARAATCGSQLRCLGVAWHLYLQDSSDVFPLGKNNTQWFYGGKEPCIYNAGFALPYRPLNPYLDKALKQTGSVDMFHCPCDRGIDSTRGLPSLTQGHTAYDYFGNSYMMNPMLLTHIDPITGLPVPTVPVQLMDVKITHQRVVLVGDCQWYYATNNFPYDADFHGKDWVNLLFLDGHAKFLQLQRGVGVNNDYSFAIE